MWYQTYVNWINIWLCYDTETGSITQTDRRKPSPPDQVTIKTPLGDGCPELIEAIRERLVVPKPKHTSNSFDQRPYHIAQELKTLHTNLVAVTGAPICVIGTFVKTIVKEGAYRHQYRLPDGRIRLARVLKPELKWFHLYYGGDELSLCETHVKVYEPDWRQWS